MNNNPSTPGKIVGDCLSTVVVLGVIFCLVGAPLIFGLSDTINAFGDGMRAVFGR